MAPELYAYKLHSYISKLHIYVCRSNSEQSRLKKKKKKLPVSAPGQMVGRVAVVSSHESK